MTLPSPSPARRSTEWRRVMLILVWALVILRIGSEFTGRGAPYWHHDLRQLFAEQQRFYGRSIEGAATPRAGRPPDRNVLVESVYPPYSFVLATLWLPPGLGWPGTRVWFTLCQAIATVVVVGFAWRQGREVAPGLGWLLAGSVLALTGLRADLLFGNYAVLTIALLVGTSRAASQQRWPLAGATWLASLLKPQVGWLFAGLFLHRRGGRTLAVVAVAVVVLTLVACGWAGVTPLELGRSQYSSRLSALAVVPQCHSLVSVLGEWGVNPGVALPGCAIAGLGVTVWVLRTRLRTAGVLAQMAFIGVINRICTYHNAGDDLLLVFALVILGRRAWQSDAGRDWALFILLGVTAWAPSAAVQTPLTRTLVVAAWIVVATALVIRRARVDCHEAGAAPVKAGGHA